MPQDLVLATDVIAVDGRLVFRGDRPGPGWHAHGTTEQRVTVLHADRLVDVDLHKQRWLEVATGHTVHDRPHFTVPWSRHGLDVVLVAVAAWLLGGVGLHRADFPWQADRPDRRTVQRWLHRLRPDSLRWHVAIRKALLDRLAPRPLEEILPTAGIPPPGGCARFSSGSVEVWPLRSGLWLAVEGARALDIPVRTLLVEARWRWTPS